MLNIHDLERRWKIYKLKSLLPYIIITISILVIIPIGYYFYINESKTVVQKKVIRPKKIVQTQVIPPKVKPNPQLKPKLAAKTITIKETSIQTLKPSMNFMKNIQHEATQPQYSQKKIQNNQAKIKRQRKIVKQKIVTEVIQDVSNEAVPVKKKAKVSITIERKETQNDIFEIVKRFKKNNNPALSLFVAKKYYELGNYKQAYNYALITNQINANIEASWIVFAKALVQLHKKDKAIHTLQEYIKVSHSSNAEILLNEIKSGKFR